MQLKTAPLALALLVSSLGTSIANVALPTLTRAFGVSFAAAQWVVLAYLLGITASIVTVGRVGDLYGRRRVLTGGLLLFTGAAAVAGLAPSFGVLLFARAAQGVGAAVLMALSLAFVGDVVPKERTGSAMGLLGATSAVGTALGPSIGGILTAQAGWRAIFLVQVPLALLALALVRRALPADRHARPTVAFDHVGTLLLATTLVVGSLALTLGRGHLGVGNVLGFGVAAVGAAVFVRVETRAAAPLVPLGILRDRTLAAGLATSAIVATILMATLVVGPFYLSLGLGLAADEVGWGMSVGPLVAALAGAPAGVLVDRLGSPRTTLAGLAGVTIGALGLAFPLTTGLVGYLAPIVLLTGSYALFQSANNTGVLNGQGAARRGVVSGMLTLSRNLGLVTGTSVLGAVFAAASGHADLAQADPVAVAAGMRATFGVAALLGVVAIGVAARPA